MQVLLPVLPYSFELMYFSEREGGQRPRVEETISDRVWGGVVTLIASRITDGSLGDGYPEACPDGQGPVGCDTYAFNTAVAAEHPDIPTPLRVGDAPPTIAILDLLEFCWRGIGEPKSLGFHSYFKHSHLSWDVDAGREKFQADVNRLFSRNGLAYEMTGGGQMRRVGPAVIREALASTTFRTGDTELNRLLERAREDFLSPSLTDRRDALEKLWDAWERVKTIDMPSDKKQSVGLLLDRAAAEPNLRKLLEEEATELTKVGNTFRIRHSERTQVVVQESDQVDYLFHRLFAMIHLVLRRTDRAG